MGNDIITLLQECDTLKARLSEMRTYTTLSPSIKIPPALSCADGI